MNYFLVLILILIAIRPLSYAKYNWDRKNRFQAFGVVLLVLLSVVLPIMILWK
jgi:hypothetical protein